MADSFFRVRNGLNLGNLSADPANGVNGDIYYNTTSNITREFVNGVWRDVVDTSSVQTITGKTLSGNTSTNFINGAGTFNLNSTGTVTVPNATDTLVGQATTDVLSNKTLTFLKTNVTTDSTSTGANATLAAGDITVGVVRLTSGALASISGVPAGASGQFLTVENKTGNQFVINNDDAGATAANRILTGTGGSIPIRADASITLVYDATTLRWMIVGGTGGSGGNAGEVSIISGAVSIIVTLPNVMTSTAYVVLAQMANITDVNPQFQPITITNKTTTTFTATWNAPVGTSNYLLEYVTSGDVLTSTINGRVSLMSDIVVGSAGDVTSGFADYSSLQSAINAASTGQKIKIRSNITIIENVTLNKRVMIEGNGYDSYINGTFAVTSTNYSSLISFRTDTMSLDASSGGNILNSMFFGVAPVDSGAGNSISGVVI